MMLKAGHYYFCLHVWTSIAHMAQICWHFVYDSCHFTFNFYKYHLLMKTPFCLSSSFLLHAWIYACECGWVSISELLLGIWNKDVACLRLWPGSFAWRDGKRLLLFHLRNRCICHFAEVNLTLTNAVKCMCRRNHFCSPCNLSFHYIVFH